MHLRIFKGGAFAIRGCFFRGGAIWLYLKCKLSNFNDRSKAMLDRPF